MIEVRMIRRKREITGLMNERDFPHLVELALPPGIVMEMQSGEGEVHSETMASHTGRCEGATAEKAVPFPSDRPSIPTPFLVWLNPSETWGALSLWRRLPASSTAQPRAR
jgi:hypothetical protein